MWHVHHKLELSRRHVWSLTSSTSLSTNPQNTNPSRHQRYIHQTEIYHRLAATANHHTGTSDTPPTHPQSPTMAALSSYNSLPTAQPAFSFAAHQTASGTPNQHSFYPYTDNGGSTLGIAGSDFTIIAGDTRLTSGYNILTRYAPKLFRIGGDGPEHTGAKIVLSVVGFAADGHALQERLDTVVKMYRYQHGKDMSVHACAQRLSHILYNKRFFPYYVQAILGGIDADGVGALYSYDPVGSYEREQCRAAGAAASLIMPFLDNQVNLKNQYEPSAPQGLEKPAMVPQKLGRGQVEELVRDAFTSAVERHIEVGDGLQMMVITKEGIEEVYSSLKQD